VPSHRKNVTFKLGRIFYLKIEHRMCMLVSDWGKKVHTSWARSGVPTGLPTSRIATGPGPLGSVSGTQDRSVKMDASIQGEVRAISCPVAGRARKGVGLGSRGPGTEREGDPRAGRVSEGRNLSEARIHVPAFEVTAMTCNGQAYGARVSTHTKDRSVVLSLLPRGRSARAAVWARPHKESRPRTLWAAALV
jgi:hypothetical protein